jgi:hypothetical protein
MSMMTHAARIQKLAETFRSAAMAEQGWVVLNLSRIGEVRVHVMSQESCKTYGWNEVWARIGGEADYHEYRGSAEKVAKELCKLLKAPSKKVGEVAEELTSKGFDGLRAPEMAATYSLDEESTFKAMEFLAEQGMATNKGDVGWFRIA